MPAGNLLIVERDGGPVYYAKWRDGSRRQVKRKLGPAWLVRDGNRWAERRGRVRPGFLDERAAVVEMDQLIRAHEARAAVPKPLGPATFEDAAGAWMHHLEHVQGAKPSTLADYRHARVAESDAAQARSRAGRAGHARVRRAATRFGDDA